MVTFSSLRSPQASHNLYRDLQNLLSSINSMTTLNLQGQINDINAAIAAIVSVNSTQTTNITNNTNSINTNTTDINNLKTRVTALEAMNLQSAVLTTNASGQISWTFPTAYSAAPVISSDVIRNTGQPYAIRIDSLSSTQVTATVFASTTITVVGISVVAPLAVVGSGIPVHIIAMRAT